MKILKFLMKYLAASKKDAILTLIILLILAVLNIFPALLIKDIFDNGIMVGNYNYVLLFSLFLLVVYIIKSLLNYRSNFILNKFSQNILSSIREDVTDKVLKLPMEFFNFKESGYIAARIGEVNNLAPLFSVNTIRLLVIFFEFIGAIIVLLSINPLFTLILLMISPIHFFINKKNMKSISASSAAALEQNAKLSNKIQQSIRGIEEVKNLSVEKEESGKIKKENRQMLKYMIKQSNSYAVGVEFLSFLGVFSNVILLVIGGKFVINSSLSIGDYMVFTNYIGKIFAPMQGLSTLSLTSASALISLKRLISFMDEISEEEDDETKKHISSIHSVEFKNVHFKYKSQESNILNDLNFKIDGTDRLMLKGSNGSGKTTIFRLLLALYSVGNGEILLNDENVELLKKSSVRKRISVVSQKIYLFNATIEDNIRYGMDISDDEYRNKVKDGKLKQLLHSLPMTENVTIIDNGCNLSGGQIQRIAIARGLLKNADVFLFDEITSNLDNDAIKALKEIIVDMLSDKICLFIEHGNELDDLCNKKIIIE